MKKSKKSFVTIKGHKYLYDIDCLCLDTFIAGKDLFFTMTGDSILNILRAIGFGKYEKVPPEYLFHSKFIAHLGMHDNQVRITDVTTNSNCEKHNKELKKYRQKCQISRTCLICPRGIDSCPVATKTKSWKHTVCGVCLKDAYLTSDNKTICPHCKQTT